MMQSGNSGRARVWGVAIGVIAADRALAVCAGLARGRSFGGVVGVGATRNAGSILGFGQRDPIWILIALAGIGVGVARVFARSGAVPGLGLLLGGAIANTAQRATAHGVADYVHVGLAKMEVAFNLADLALLVGAVLATRAIAQLPVPTTDRVERG